MIRRRLHGHLHGAIARFPVAGLLGARQTGKTTLATHWLHASRTAAVRLDLERPADLAKLEDAESYLESHADKLVVIDEVQLRPELFGLIRALVDDRRRNGRFLLLGSASLDLVRGASESLAGRIRFLELAPFTLGEISPSPVNVPRLWLRGGFPRSFLGRSDAESHEWRDAFIRTHLERDLPTFGIGVPAASLFRFWTMLAHAHGQLWNGAKIAASLGVSVPTSGRWLDILEGTFMVRRLSPWFSNAKKRLVKSPKVYLRDSGLLHSLLNLRSREDLLSHPIAGASWEGWVIEQLLARLPPGWRPWFYRTSAGAEIDLLLEAPGGRFTAIDIKLASAPTVTKGFRNALGDFRKIDGYVICRTKERYSLGGGVTALPVARIAEILR